MPRMDWEDQLDQTRDRIVGRGDEIYRENQNRGELDSGRAGRYRDIGEEYMSPLWEGRGGYSPEELARIYGDDRLDELGWLGDMGDYAYSDSEQAGMYGDPDTRYRYFDWDTAIGDQQNSEARQRGFVDRMRDDLSGSITPGLRLRAGFEPGVYGAIDSSDAAANAAINKGELNISQDFVDKYRMSPEDMRRIEVAGALGVKESGQAAIDRATEQAKAAGMNPLGLTALTERVRKQTAADAADQLMKGRLAANTAAAERENVIEQTRLGAAGRYADMAGSMAMRQGDRRAGIMTDVERMNLDTERDISNRLRDNATVVGGAGLSAEQGINAQGRQVNQYYTGMGTDIATGVDRDYRQTARDIAQNRVGGTQARSNDRFRNLTYTDTARTNRGAGAAGARRDDRNLGFSWLGGQQETYNRNAQSGYDRQLQGYGQQNSAMLNSDQARENYERRPKWWERALGAAAGAAGAFFGGNGIPGLNGQGRSRQPGNQRQPYDRQSGE